MESRGIVHMATTLVEYLTPAPKGHTYLKWLRWVFIGLNNLASYAKKIKNKKSFIQAVHSLLSLHQTFLVFL